MEKVRGGGTPLLARWTTDWDCGYETGWWYTIIDSPFDITALKSDYRRRIRIGMRNFTCRVIDPVEYSTSMAKITKADWSTYPEKYRPQDSEESLVQSYCNTKEIVWGAFDEAGALSAFQIIRDCEHYYSLEQGKCNPEKQRLQVNAALIASYLEYYSNEIAHGKFISNGARNIIHETNFNEDLCKKYGFRKAYCRLCIRYNPKIEWLIRCLYPFRQSLLKLDDVGVVHQINAVLKMESIVRG